MIGGDILAAFVYALLAVLTLAAVASAASNGLVRMLTWIDERDQRRLARDARTFDEPSRRDVENAYGPLVLYGPSGEAYDGTVDLPRRGRSA